MLVAAVVSVYKPAIGSHLVFKHISSLRLLGLPHQQVVTKFFTVSIKNPVLDQTGNPQLEPNISMSDQIMVMCNSIAKSNALSPLNTETKGL